MSFVLWEFTRKVEAVLSELTVVLYEVSMGTKGNVKSRNSGLINFTVGKTQTLYLCDEGKWLCQYETGEVM